MRNSALAPALAPLLLLPGVLGCGATVEGGHGRGGGGGFGQDGGPNPDSGGTAGSGGSGGAGGGGAGGGAAGSGGGGGAGGGEGGSGGGGAGGSDKEPECSRYFGKFAVPDPFETAGDMWCYVNANRERYSIHGRNSGCGWGAKAGSGTAWPYQMKWAPDLMAKAQKEVERVAGGGSPKESAQSNGLDAPLWLSGCASTEYTVTSTKDSLDDWFDTCKGDDCTYNAGLSNGNGTARMSVYYYDPGSGSPVLKRLGVGLAKTGKLRNWVLIFAP